MAKRAGHLAADVLRMITWHIRPGITTDEIDQLCHSYIVEVLQAIPANVGYNGYPKTVCTSVNHVVCHGIPSAKQLKKGDIVNVDCRITELPSKSRAGRFSPAITCRSAAS